MNNFVKVIICVTALGFACPPGIAEAGEKAKSRKHEMKLTKKALKKYMEELNAPKIEESKGWKADHQENAGGTQHYTLNDTGVMDSGQGYTLQSHMVKTEKGWRQDGVYQTSDGKTGTISQTYVMTGGRPIVQTSITNGKGQAYNRTVDQYGNVLEGVPGARAKKPAVVYQPQQKASPVSSPSLPVFARSNNYSNQSPRVIENNINDSTRDDFFIQNPTQNAYVPPTNTNSMEGRRKPGTQSGLNAVYKPVQIDNSVSSLPLPVATIIRPQKDYVFNSSDDVSQDTSQNSRKPGSSSLYLND